jgi:hypothetical protein
MRFAPSFLQVILQTAKEQRQQSKRGHLKTDTAGMTNDSSACDQEARSWEWQSGNNKPWLELPNAIQRANRFVVNSRRTAMRNKSKVRLTLVLNGITKRPF